MQLPLQPYRDAIYTWMRSQVDETVTVIWADQSAPRPERPYASLKLVTPSVKVGGRDNLRQDSQGHMRLNGPRKMLVSINIFGDGALDILTTVRDSLDDPTIVDYFNEAGLSVIQEGEVKNLSELLESHIQTRAQLDMELGYQFEGAVKTGTITKTNINGKDIGV